MMNDAPEKVWLDVTSEDEDGFFIVEAEKRHGNMDVEYVRADKYKSLESTLEKTMTALNDSVKIQNDYLKLIEELVIQKKETPWQI